MCGETFDTLQKLENHFEEVHKQEEFCKICCGSYPDLAKHKKEYEDALAKIIELNTSKNISKRVTE